MKCRILIGLLIVGLASATDVRWQVLETTKGKAYNNATLTKVEPDGLRIIHDGGAAKVSFGDLDETVRNQFGYNEAAAQKFKKDQEDARRKQINASKAVAALKEFKKKADREFRYKISGKIDLIKDNGILLYSATASSDGYEWARLPEGRALVYTADTQSFVNGSQYSSVVYLVGRRKLGESYVMAYTDDFEILVEKMAMEKKSQQSEN